MNTEIWLLGTAIIFTLVGIVIERRAQSARTSIIIEATVDRLIKDNYIRSKLDKNGEIELLKYYEE